MLHTKAEVLRKSIDKSDGILDAVVGSSEVLDRMGDTISQSGWKLSNYKKSNPVVLWGHNVKEERPPIGKALKVWIVDKGEKASKLMFKVQFDLQDNFASEIFRKVKEGFINTVSVGFLPIEWEQIDEDDPYSGRKYSKQELLELSFVPVPANPEAVVALKEMKDKRFDPVKLEDIYVEAKEEKEEKEEKEIVEKDTLKEKVEKVVKKIKKMKKEKVEGAEEEKKEKEVKDEPKEAKKQEEVKGEEISADDIKPYENEHSCRLRSPSDFQSDSFRRTKRKHDGKEYLIIMGRLKSKTKMTEQAYRYNKSAWSSSSAGSHCKSHGGTFHPAKAEEVPETKGVIPYKDLGRLPESASWDGPGEVARAGVSDLKLICAWYDSENPDVKSSYKLPHHNAEGHKAVWRGVAAAMAALLGARGGTKIPTGDRKGIFNHLKKHYVAFGKEPPKFKAVKRQILSGFEEEIHAMILDREDKYIVRLLKKILKTQKRKALKKSENVTNEEIIESLKILDSAIDRLL